MNCEIFKCTLNGDTAPEAEFNYDEHNFERSFSHRIEIN